MTRKKKQTIAINDATIKAVTTNPAQLADGALKIASTLATIYAAKLALDLFADDDLVEWLTGHSGGSGGLFGGSMNDILVRLVVNAPKAPGIVAMESHAQGIIQGLTDAYNFANNTSLYELLTGLTAKTHAAGVQWASITDEIASLQVDLDHAQQSYDNAVADHSSDNDPILSLEHQALVWERLQVLNVKTAFLDNLKKSEAVSKAETEYKTSLAERCRWELAIIGGTILATTMIFAGDSVIDLAAAGINALGKILGNLFGLLEIGAVV